MPLEWYCGNPVIIQKAADIPKTRLALSLPSRAGATCTQQSDAYDTNLHGYFSSDSAFPLLSAASVNRGLQAKASLQFL